MTKQDIIRKASYEMEKRRQLAEKNQQERTEEIYKKIPQIEEIRRMLARTSTELTKDIIRRQKGGKSAFSDIKRNNLECRDMIKRLLRDNGYPEDYLEMHYRCPECEDTGYVDGAMCVCMKRLSDSIAAEEMNRTANMPNADFEHFSLDYYRNVVINKQDCYAIMSGNLNYCKDYARNFSPSSGSILMQGKTGTGKTHLSMSVAKEVMKAGYSVIYGSADNLLRAVEKEHFGNKYSEEGTLDTLLECDLLIIDDLGSEFITSFTETALYNIINTRINTGRATIASTNLDVKKLTSSYDERIISRIIGVYRFLWFAGKDIRQIKQYDA